MPWIGGIKMLVGKWKESGQAGAQDAPVFG